VDKSSIRSFVERRWDLVEREKIRARSQRYQLGGPAACQRASAELWERFQSLGGGKAREQRRNTDLEHHIALARTLAKISRDAAPRR
jgi:hypothetical protein